MTHRFKNAKNKKYASGESDTDRPEASCTIRTPSRVMVLCTFTYL